jgi:hypothetical protein
LPEPKPLRRMHSTKARLFMGIEEENLVVRTGWR